MTLNNKLDVLWKGGLLSLCLLAITIAGCDSMSSSNKHLDETGPIVPNFDQSRLSESAIATNDKLERISRAVAKVLADDEIRQYVYERVMEQRTGEPTVLWMHLNRAEKGNVPAALQQKQGYKWGKLLLQRSHGVLGQQFGQVQKLNAAIKRAGRLLGGPIHIGWVKAEKSDPSIAPWVTFTPVGVDADEITDIMAFDAQGNQHLVNREIASNRPVVVISNDERADFDGNLLSASTKSTGLLISHQETCIDCGGTGGGGGGTGDGSGSGDGVQFMILDKLAFGWDSEGYLKHHPEFKANIYALDDDYETVYLAGTLDLTNQVHEDLCDGTYFTVDKSITGWDPEDVYSFQWLWYEFDGDTKASFDWDVEGDFEYKINENNTITSTVNYSLSMEWNDDTLNAIMVHYDELATNGDDAQYEFGMPDMDLGLE